MGALKKMPTSQLLPGRRRGPRREDAAASRTEYVGFRAVHGLKGLIEGAAASTGRSLSAETQFRVETTFQKQDLEPSILELHYGRRPAAILLAVAREMTRQGRVGAFLSTGTFEGMEGWVDDPFAYEQAARAAIAVIERFRPPGDPSLLKNGKRADEGSMTMGERAARITLDAIADPAWGDQFSEPNKNRELERFAEKERELWGGPLPDRGAPEPEKA